MGGRPRLALWRTWKRRPRLVIPEIIFQTWRSADVPETARLWCRSWQDKNPSCEYRFYDDAACRGLVEQTAPQFLDAYLQFPHAVMRADFFRYAAMYRHGGIYADIDMECMRPIGHLLDLAPVVLAVEAHVTGRRRRELNYSQPLQIANCILFGTAGHPFFLAAMERSVALWRSMAAIHRSEIEDVTGPRMLTRLFYERHHRDIAVLRQIVLMPPRHYPNVWPFNAHTYARHHFFGSWKAPERKAIGRRWIERDRWPNPFGAGLIDEDVSERIAASGQPRA